MYQIGLRMKPAKTPGIKTIGFVISAMISYDQLSRKNIISIVARTYPRYPSL